MKTVIIASHGQAKLYRIQLDDPDVEARIFVIVKDGQALGRFAGIVNATNRFNELTLKEGE
jgi:hypothetical protein